MWIFSISRIALLLFKTFLFAVSVTMFDIKKKKKVRTGFVIMVVYV